MKKRKGITVLVSVILIVVLQLVAERFRQAMPNQNEASVWGGENYAQVSCYTGKQDGFTLEELMRFEYEMNRTLKDSGSGEKERVAELWTDAYSARSRITVNHGNTAVEGVVYGVGNDFFAFHPLTLVSGGYIDSENVMKDYILLDEESAWRLFGSSDVAGMSVDINGDLFSVAGVYARPEGRWNDAAGNGEITYYMSYETLQKYDETMAVTCYEVMMTNPVEHYAYDLVKKYFQPEEEVTAQADAEESANREMVIVENSDRGTVRKLFASLKQWDLNTMDTDEIQYPYWENIAKAFETVLVRILFLQLICMIPLVCVLCVWAWSLYKNKGRMIACIFAKIKKLKKI